MSEPHFQPVLIPPTRLTGGEFEASMVRAATSFESMGVMSMARCGVFATRVGNQWMVRQSRPDFEGTMFGGRGFYIEAKVCSAAKLNLKNEKIVKEHQINFLKRRAKLGQICCLMIHFNEMRLVRSHRPAVTKMLPIHPSMPMFAPEQPWETVESIDRDHPDLVECPWVRIGKAKKDVPDLEWGIMALIKHRAMKIIMGEWEEHQPLNRFTALP